MDEFDLAKLVEKINKIDHIINSLKDLCAEDTKTVKQVTGTINWLNKYKKQLNKEYDIICNELVEEAEALADIYNNESNNFYAYEE